MARQARNKVASGEKYETACVRATNERQPSRVTLGRRSSRSAITQRTTWQVKFCIHESRSAGDIGARLNEPLCLLLWFQRGPLTAEEYSFKYLSILGSARRGPPPTLGMDLCAPTRLPVFSRARAPAFFPVHVHNDRTHTTPPTSDLCRRYSRSTFIQTDCPGTPRFSVYVIRVSRQVFTCTGGASFQLHPQSTRYWPRNNTLQESKM